MSRGDICIAATRGECTGKPRPVVIVQDDRFDATASVTVCPLTTHLVEAPLLRLSVSATALTGIERDSQLMVDKITTVPRSRVGESVGRIADSDLVILDRALVVFLGLAG